MTPDADPTHNTNPDTTTFSNDAISSPNPAREIPVNTTTPHSTPSNPQLNKTNNTTAKTQTLPSNTLIPETYTSLSTAEFSTYLTKSVAYKERSYQTYAHEHRIELNQTDELGDSPRINTAFLGDSTLERFKTTGKDTQTGQLSYPKIFNGGVGGDKIENLLYRLDLGMIDQLKNRGIKLWVIGVGTNNLKKSRLTEENMKNYMVLLQLVLRMNKGIGKVIVCGISKRKDVPNEFVDSSNAEIESLIARINENLEKEGKYPTRIQFLEVPKAIKMTMLEDHVHMTAEGYHIWDAALYPYIKEANTPGNLGLRLKEIEQRVTQGKEKDQSYSLPSIPPLPVANSNILSGDEAHRLFENFPPLPPAVSLNEMSYDIMLLEEQMAQLNNSPSDSLLLPPPAPPSSPVPPLPVINSMILTGDAIYDSFDDFSLPPAPPPSPLPPIYSEPVGDLKEKVE